MAGKLYTSPQFNCTFLPNVSGWANSSNLTTPETNDFANNNSYTNNAIMYTGETNLPKNIAIRAYNYHIIASKENSVFGASLNFALLYPASFDGSQQYFEYQLPNSNDPTGYDTVFEFNTFGTPLSDNLIDISNNFNKQGEIFPNSYHALIRTGDDTGEFAVPAARLYQFAVSYQYYSLPTVIRSPITVFKGKTSIKPSINSTFAIDPSNPRGEFTEIGSDSGYPVIGSGELAEPDTVSVVTTMYNDSPETAFRFDGNESRLSVNQNLLQTPGSSFGEIIADDDRFKIPAFNFAFWFRLDNYVDYIPGTYTLFSQTYDILTPSTQTVNVDLQYFAVDSGNENNQIANSICLTVKVGNDTPKILTFIQPANQINSADFTKPKYISCTIQYSTGEDNTDGILRGSLFTKLDNENTDESYVVEHQQLTTPSFIPKYRNSQVGGYILNTEKMLIGTSLYESL